MDLVRVGQELRVEGKRHRGRPKLTWEQVIRGDMRAWGIDRTLAHDRRAWRAAIRRPDPADGGTRVGVD